MKPCMIRPSCHAAILGIAALWSVGIPGQAVHPAGRRQALVVLARKKSPAVLRTLTEALADPNAVVRRTAARLLLVQGPAARSALERAMKSSDALVRKTAVQGLLALASSDSERSVAHLREIVVDESLPIRLLAVERLALLQPRTPAVEELLKILSKDQAAAVRRVAARALWPFHREVIPLRERADWDHEVTVLQTVPLPKEDWRFQLDRGRDGHLKKWYEPALDDSAWDTIAIEQAWQKAGYDYIGVAWYRRRVDMPAKPDAVNAVEIAFDGVDESAWVWVNGTYAGQHDIGPNGWDQPFTLDITDAIQWGQSNQITVRAMNTAHAGGIWRPVRIEILK